MNDIPKPSVYDVYWERWIDAFEAEEEQFEEDVSDIEHMLTNEEIDEVDPVIRSVSHVRSIMTPFGILPLTEQNMASKYFKFWVGHSNFKLTKEFYNVIGRHPGIETLEILTPYRFRVAICKMFVDRDVMTSVRDTMVQYISTNKRNIQPNDISESQ